MDSLGMAPEDFSQPSDLAHLPILTKVLMRDNMEDLKASNLPEEEFCWSVTGGTTTGRRTEFYLNNACFAAKEAAKIRHERWTGWDIGKPRGLIWPAHQDLGEYQTTRRFKLRNALSARESQLPAAVLNDVKIEAYLKKIERQRPVLLRGFATPVYQVAAYIKRVRRGTCHVPSVITTGEPLYPHQRSVISEAFRAEVFDAYMTREVSLIAQECSEHQGMHINAENILVEVLEAEPPLKGKVLVTDLLNYGMPFVRFDIGDTGEIATRECSCGRGLPLMEMGVAREGDVLFAPTGNAVAGVSLIAHIVGEGPPLGQIQFIQNALDHLLIRLTKDPMPDSELYNFCRKTVAELFGEEMRVSFELVDSIEAEPSGKFLFTVCKIPKEDRPSEL
jgi:phenylacetate-CoA ligase